MPLPLGELAQRCGAVLQGGDSGRLVSSAASLAEAGPSDLAPLTDPRYARLLPETRAAAVLLKTGSSHLPPPVGTALLFANDPEVAFLRALAELHPAIQEAAGVDPRACVEPGVHLDQDVGIGPCAIVRSGARIGAGTRIFGGVYVGRECQIGARCRLYPRVVIYDGVVLGDDVIVHAGSVLGADGFGYKFRDGRHVKVPQVGILRVGDGVEIGANTCIDRAALGETSIGAGSKIDNLVQVGHNVKMGKHVILCGQAGVAGSVVLEDYAVLGANAGIADHLTIGMAARVGAKAGVIQDLPAHSEVWGLPADERRAFWRQIAALRKLPEFSRRIRDLEARIEKLQSRHAGAERSTKKATAQGKRRPPVGRRGKKSIKRKRGKKK